jgi:rSAM/selenodomain-associated transferase 1
MRVASVIDGYARAVSIGDLSKPLGLGGLRIGWIATRDRALLDACAGILDYRSGSVSALSARVAVAALSRFDALLEVHVERARENLSSLAAFVDAHEAWLDWTPPQVGYTAFVRVRSSVPGPAFFDALAGDGVFALDGAAFDAPGHIRVGFGMSSSELARGLAAFSRALRLHVAPSALPQPRGDVIVLAKQPVAGYAKTRLASVLGRDEAARLAEAFLRDTLAFAAGRARRLYAACAPDASAFRTLAPGARCFAQPDGDLGARLAHAFEMAFRDGASRPVLIGADSPTLPSQLLTAAHEALGSHDVVIGPALDGGYYLIGMRELHRSLFDRIDWSSDLVLAQTLARARAAGLDVFVLPRWYDVDDASGLARLRRDRGARAHTAAALQAGAMAEAVG